MNRQTLSQREKLSKIDRILNPSEKARETFRAMLIPQGKIPKDDCDLQLAGCVQP